MRQIRVLIRPMLDGDGWQMFAQRTRDTGLVDARSAEAGGGGDAQDVEKLLGLLPGMLADLVAEPE